MTMKEWLEKLAGVTTSDGEDYTTMEALLRTIGFPHAKVTSGIVYLEGQGTHEAPPASIHQVAGMTLKMA